MLNNMQTNKSAQSIVDYAIIFGLVTVALVSMQVYFKRGVQAVAKTSVDQLAGFGSTEPEFSPERIQQMGIEQESDPKYGKLSAYEVQNTVDHSVTVKTLPQGKREITINKWEDHVEDVPDASGNKGKVFWQDIEKEND